VYNSTPVKVDNARIESVITYLNKYADEIDAFLHETPGLGDLKNIMYTFVNQTAKAKQLDNLGPQQFFNWLKTSKVSTNKQTKIQELSQQHKYALSAIFGLVKQIMDMKDDVIDQIEQGQQGEIWDTHGEGRVRYADKSKQFGNVKLVPRKRWTPT
jgi:flavodoxin